MVIVALVSLGMTTHLIGFHAWISKLGITTFDYIMFNRALNEQLDLVKVSVTMSTLGFMLAR